MHLLVQCKNKWIRSSSSSFFFYFKTLFRPRIGFIVVLFVRKSFKIRIWKNTFYSWTEWLLLLVEPADKCMYMEEGDHFPLSIWMSTKKKIKCVSNRKIWTKIETFFLWKFSNWNGINHKIHFAIVSNEPEPFSSNIIFFLVLKLLIWMSLSIIRNWKERFDRLFDSCRICQEIKTHFFYWKKKCVKCPFDNINFFFKMCRMWIWYI